MTYSSVITNIVVFILPKRWFQHFAFWAVSFYVLLNIFKLGDTPTSIDYIYTGIFHTSLVLSVYANLWLGITIFLKKRSYNSAMSVFTGTIVLAAFVNNLIFERIVDYILPGYYFISYYDFIDLIKFHLVYVSISTLLKLSKSWFKLAEAEKLIAVSQQEKNKAELEALKSQINPHFLFNSLNNIHALSRQASPKTSKSILVLSEMMRYVLYETKADYVKLSAEIQFLNNFVELQKLRIDERSEIKLDVDLENDKLNIAPLILLPFFENSFKHGVKGNTGNTFARFELKNKGNELLFFAENNKGKSKDEEGSHGIGLANVIRRLDILYSDKYKLDIVDEGEVFQINLKLVLDEQNQNIRKVYYRR
ncbi:MAG: hypothetical protein CVU00_01210 [Bacteroidetes bacterium HGW-Bacteroidetes-17]|jgi:sensor histidine kinase YesM|nr:MAG: hypothetical protein CVU00_01210 [Bacteroidetes bacterium HGW-Bacteroidetes-17]